MSLSVVIVAKNEQLNINDCIESVRFADEIVVIDDMSTDATASIAQSLGAVVYQRAMDGDYASQYNYGFTKATKDWVLIVDADERVTPELRDEILAAVANGERRGYEISHLNYVMGQPLRHGGWYSNGGIRLFPRGTVHLEGYVHSRMVHDLPLVKLTSYYLHYPYPTWERYFEKFNRYTELAAAENFRKKRPIRIFNDDMLRPFAAFFKMYVLKSGWRDGKIGFVLAVFHFFYTMAKYVKSYYRQKEY